MEVTAGIIPTYLPSTRWIQNKLDPSQLKTRDFTRTIIESNSPEGMKLTVPVIGGSSSAKRLKPEQLQISGHGDWTRIHLGAIEAAYGKEPFFQHLFPDIAGIISNYPEQLSDMNLLLLKAMLDFVNYKDGLKDMAELKASNPKRLEEISARMEAKINPGHSFLEPLFRLGPDSIFLL